MRLRHEFLSAHPPERVLGAYSDAVPGFAPHLPMVKEVVEVESRNDGSIRHRVHCWKADVSRFPGFLTGMIDARVFQWTTCCIWDLARSEGSWTLQIGAFGEGTHIEGWHRFVADDDGCRTEVEGVVLVQATQFGSVAGFPTPAPIQRALDRLIQRVFTEIVAKSGEVVERSLDDVRT